MPSKLSLAIARPALSVAAVLAILGAYTLVTGRSPRGWFARPLAEFQIHFDREREAAAARNPGEYRIDVDPRVGYTLRANAELTSVDAVVHTDDLGLRKRTAPEPARDARTIVILGDSVAFGTGVADEACLAQRIEDEFAAARGRDGPRDWIGRTVAVPGWNWRNEVAFLEDHLDRLQPSIVLCMPISNDVTDSESVWETGHRRVAADLAQPDPLLFVSLGGTRQLLLSYLQRVRKGALTLSDEEIGPLALDSDLGGESARRFDDMADGIARLAGELERRGVRFALLEYEENAFVHALARRLTRRAPKLRWIALLDRVTPKDVLPTDPHVNATVDKALAHWTARELIEELHWVDGRISADALPTAYARRRAVGRSTAETEALAAKEREQLRARLRDAIEPANGHGIQQIYGGLSPTAAVGARLLAAFARRPGFLELDLAPLADRPDLYPMHVRVEVDGRSLGELTLGEPGSSAAVHARFPLDLPPIERADGASCDTFDVKLVPERFAVIDELGGKTLASCRLVRLARVDG